MAHWLQKQWFSYTCWHILLIPLSWLFGLISWVRKSLYKHGWLKSYRLTVPVIIVGNINVGGTGKTPLVIWLAEQLKIAGYKPGIISRGYGGTAKDIQAVLPNSNPQEVGDEPVLIAKHSNCPVFVSPNRVAAGQALLKAHPECNIVISDDGLQHYRLQRDVEIAVLDGAKGFGNGALLPVGPLREPISRLSSVDALVSNGKATHKSLAKNSTEISFSEMQLESGLFYNLIDNNLKCDAQSFANQQVLAVAGIGNPERFFQQLQSLGLNFKSLALPDHHKFQSSDFNQVSADIIVMTEKDAVKCDSIAQPNYWVLPVFAVISGELIHVVLNKLQKIQILRK
jgi:tetraacyldisaccharide 4'-kinase